MKHGKQIIVLLLAWVLLLCMPVSVAASSTELTTSVPTHASLTIEVSGRGTVWVGLRGIRWEKTISVQRNVQTKITIRPDYGHEISSIVLDGTDITSQMNDGILSLEVTSTDHVLSVTFVRSEDQCPKPDFPGTDPDINTPIIWWIQSVQEFLRWIFQKP